jgi:hypothetical protein
VHLHTRVPRIDLRLLAVSFDDELVVPIGLDVQLPSPGESDDLHRQIVRYPVVQQHRAIELAYLRALVTDEGTVEAELLDPRSGAGERPACADDHRDAGVSDVLDRLDVARVQAQVKSQDRAVEVEREELVAKGEGYFLTSGLTRFGGLPPRTAVAMLRAAIADISERVRTVALAMCGASTTLGICRRPGCTAGSRS